jgi:hypothetical protein
MDLKLLKARAAEAFFFGWFTALYPARRDLRELMDLPSPAEAMRSDWEAVGNDLRKALEDAKKEYGTQLEFHRARRKEPALR